MSGERPPHDPEALAAENRRLRRTVDVLVRRVEQSMEAQGSSFAVFEAAILLEKKVQQRTQELGQAMQKLQETNRALATAKDLADAGSRAKSEFLAMMSHEIRTPLNGILGLLELLRASDLQPNQVDLMSGIGRSAELLLSILNDVLDLSKLEAGRMELEATDHELRPLVEGVRALFEGVCWQKGLRIECQFADGVPEVVHCDATRLRQVLVNLTGNAVKFTAEGSVTLRVLPAAQPGLLRFEVADTGIGIAPEHRERLFLPFSQADPSMARRYGGTGLGLSISRTLCERMGGELDVSSEPGRGSVFWFTVQAPAAAAMARRQPAADLPRFAARVLVVDDHPINLKVTSGMLRRLGCTPCTAADGGTAVSLAVDEPFDLVLMDIQMPGMDGLETTRCMRATAANAALPIVALTANTLPGDEQRCLEAGMQGYLRKPLRLADLAAMLTERLPASCRRPG